MTDKRFNDKRFNEYLEVNRKEIEKLDKRIERAEKIKKVLNYGLVACAILHAVRGAFYGAEVNVINISVWVLLTVIHSTEAGYLRTGALVLSIIFFITSIFI